MFNPYEQAEEEAKKAFKEGRVKRDDKSADNMVFLQNLVAMQKKITKEQYNIRYNPDTIATIKAFAEARGLKYQTILSNQADALAVSIREGMIKA